MLKKDLLNNYGISNYYFSHATTDELFSMNDMDPALHAESHGYEFANGRPFITTITIGHGYNCTIWVVIFKDYKSKCSYIYDGVTVNDL